MRSSLSAKRLEPVRIVAALAVQLPANLAACQLLGSNECTLLTAEVLRNKDIRCVGASTTGNSLRVVAFCTDIGVLRHDERVVDLQGSICPTCNTTYIPEGANAFFRAVTNQVSLDETVADHTVCTAIASDDTTGRCVAREVGSKVEGNSNLNVINS